MEVKVLNVTINLAGGNASKNATRCRLQLPSKWVHILGLTKESRSLKATFDSGRIILERAKESDGKPEVNQRLNQD